MFYSVVKCMSWNSKEEMGNNITCGVSCNYTMAAAVCTTETWLVSGT